MNRLPPKAPVIGPPSWANPALGQGVDEAALAPYQGMSKSIDGLNFYDSKKGWMKAGGLAQIEPREWEFFKKVYPDYTELFKIDIEGNPHPDHSHQDAIRLNNAVSEMFLMSRWQDKAAQSAPPERHRIQTDVPEQRQSGLGFGADFDAGPVPTGSAKGFWDKINRRR